MLLKHPLTISKPVCQKINDHVVSTHNVFVRDYFIGVLVVSDSCSDNEKKYYDFVSKDKEYESLNDLIWTSVDNRWFIDNRQTSGLYSFSIDILPNTQNTTGICHGTITITYNHMNDNDTWEGWATSTYFGDGEKEWPSGVPNAENLDDINNPDAMTYGAAIPWRYYCKQYGSRANLLVAYQNNWVNGGNELFCFDVQPIRVTPDTLKQGSYDEPGSSTGTMDINSDDVVALQENGLPYPIFQVVPYEGCGGDCTPVTCPDCFNSCIGQEQEQTLNILNCNFSDTTTPCCSSMKILYDDGNWQNTDDIHTQFTTQGNTQPTAIDYTTLTWDRTSQRVNWCSGFSFHFDFAYPSAPWNSLAPDPTRGPNERNPGDQNNVMLRYRRRKCQNWSSNTGLSTR
jgi:hypothetical protein